jgi:quercetin dioxygenase-like cupin family protein
MTIDKHFVMPQAKRPRALNVVGTKVTVLAASSATQAYGMTFQQGQEGSGPPPHSHDWDEAFYVLSGEIHFQCGDEKHTCSPGTLVHVPRNTVHGFTYGKGGGSMLEITSRDSKAAEMFMAIDAAIDPQAPDIPRTLQVLEDNGVTVPK